MPYTLKQINQNTLELNLSKAFLERSEWGGQNVSPTITLYNKEGRKFPQKYTFKLRANTPPPALEYKALCKTQDGSKWYYVLCFKVSDMDKTVSTELLHKDITAITVTPQGGTAQIFPLTVGGSGFDISKSGVLLPAARVNKLDTADVEQGVTPDNKPTENWVIYFKTDVEVKGAEKIYSFKLIDQKGLNSPEVKVSSSSNKLPAVTLYHGNTLITAENEAYAHLINIGGSTATVSLQAKAKEGTGISGIIERKSGSGWSKVSDVSGTTASSIPLPPLENSEYEALYKISLRSIAQGYSESVLRTFFIKLTNELVVTFSVEGGQGGNLKGSCNGNTQTASGNDPKTFIMVPNSTASFTAIPTEGWEVDSWKGVTLDALPSDKTKATLSNITKAKTVTVKFKKKTYTVTFSVEGGQGGSLKGTYDQTSRTASESSTASLTVLHGEGVSFTAQPAEGWEVDSWSVDGAVESATSPTYIFSGITTAKNVMVKFKKKTYTITFKVDGGNGSLKCKYNGTEETANGNDTKTLTVPYNGSVSFTATSADLTRYKVGDWTCTPSIGFMGQSGQAAASLTVTANTSVSVQFVQLNALTLKKLTIHGQDASAGAVTLPYAKDKVKKEHIILEFNGQPGIDFILQPAELNLTAGVPQDLIINVAASPGNYPAWSKTVRVTRSQR